MHTRYSPVRRSPPKYCYLVLPLDLHVLSLPLAFILSQDQTLRCKNCIICLLRRFLLWSLSKILTSFLDETSISPGYATSYFQRTFTFGASKVMLLYFLSKKNRIFFPACFSFFFPCFSKPEHYPSLLFNQLFALKRVQR